MSKKIKLGLLFGGKSPEHEVSLSSARNVYNALDLDRYEVVMIGVDREGRWFGCKEIGFSEHDTPLDPFMLSKQIDLIIPILHGPNGEDGTMQGLFRLLGLPFVGADVLGSAVGMDKDVMKRLLKEGGLNVAPFIAIQDPHHPLEEVLKTHSFPFFVKPSNAGSSIGISKVKDETQYQAALDEAFLYDEKILIEEAIVGRELECSLLGNEAPIASLPCEVTPHGEFHSYSSKYLEDGGATIQIPALLAPDEAECVMDEACKAFRLLGCSGLARVDLFYTHDKKLYINEINTIPGLTNMSPYAKMWEATGVPFPKVVDQLIDLAFERHSKRGKLLMSREKLWMQT